MSKIISDSEIEALLTKVKPLPKGWRGRLSITGLRARPGEAHKRRDLALNAESGECFAIKCRQGVHNPLDFSVVLVYLDSAGNEYRLLRCNGWHESQHTNHLEKCNGATGHTFGPSFHIHRATQRYQEAGRDIDGFAEGTTAYSDYESALEWFVSLTGCVDSGAGPTLFKGI